MIFVMTFTYIPLNPFLLSIKERAEPSKIVEQPPKPPKEPPTKPLDAELNIIKTYLDEVKNLFEKPLINQAQLRRALEILTEIEHVVYQMRNDEQYIAKRWLPMNTHYVVNRLDIFNDALQGLKLRLNHFKNSEELEVCRNDLKNLEEVYSQIRANLHDNEQTDHQSSPDT
jgi:hypothetical protein